jgi:hypothetical protein
MLAIGKSIEMICLTPGCSVFSNFVASRQCVYGKLEKHSLWSFWARPRRLLIRHSSSNSETLDLLCHVIGRERGTPRASSVVTQQEFVEL